MYIHRIEERRMKGMDERRKWSRIGVMKKGSILCMVSTSIIEDGESIKGGSEMQKWFVGLL